MEPEDNFRLRAREPLKHAAAAQELLDHHDEFEEHPEWVLFWVAGVALLRAVGHVLDKVDGAKCPKLKEIIARRWAEWKADRTANAIFWNFIEEERNNVLKVFELGVEGVDRMPLIIESPAASDEQKERVYQVDFRSTGEDGRDLFHEALKWWQSQLDAIEFSGEQVRQDDDPE